MRLALALLLLVGVSTSAWGQSGRRKPPPPPRPGPVPEATPPVYRPSPGVTGENRGLAWRFVLENGTVVVVYERPGRGLIHLAAIIDDGSENISAALMQEVVDGGVVEAVCEPVANGAGLTFRPGVEADACQRLAGAVARLMSSRPGTGPRNVTVAAAGDVDSFEMAAVARDTFGKLGPGTEAERPRPVTTATPAYRAVRDRDAGVVVEFWWPAPERADKDGAALDVMIAALATGHTSRLGRALVGGGIAASVEATLDRGFVVTLRTSPQFIDTAEATLLRELDRLRRERLTDGELQRACNQASRTWWGRFSRLREVASLLGGFEAGEGNALQALEYGARLLGVSTLDVNRVAREIFNAGSLRVVEHLPHGGIDRSFTADAFAATVDSWAPGLGKHVSEDEVRAAPAQPRITEGRPRQSEVQPAWSPIAVPVRDFSTKHGPTAFVAEDQMLPLVSIGVFVAGGRSQETDSQQGLTELLLSVVAWQPDGKLQLIEQLGGELRPVVARDWFGLVVEAPSRNAELVTMALVDLFEHSSLDQKAMELQRRRLDLSAPFLAEEPLARAEELYWQGRFQGHPYGRTRSDTRVLARVTLEDLAMWRATTIGVQTPLVGVVGDSDGSSLVAAFFAEAFERTEAAAPPRVQPLPNLSQSTERAEYRSGRVTSVVVGYPAVTLQEALDALEVVAAWAGSAWGPAGRRLRGVDARATLRSAVARDRIASSILFGFEASPASEPGLTAALDAQVRGLASTPMSDADLRTSKALAAIRLEMAVENPSERLLRYAGETMRGGRAAAAELAPQRVQLITAPLLRQVAEGTFVPSHSGRGMVRAH